MKTEASKNSQQIPQGWAWIRLGDCFELKYGKGLREAERRGGEIPVFGSNGIVGYHDTAVTKGQSIIVGRKGSIGEVVFSDTSCWPIDTTYYIDDVPEHIGLRWLFWALKFANLPELNKGSTIPGLNREDVYDLPMACPPLARQHAIVAKLEAQMAEAQRLQHAAERQLGSAISLPQNIVNHEMNQAGNQEGYLIDVLRSIPTSGWPHAYGNELEGIPFLTLTAVLNFQYDGTQVKYTDTPVNQNGDYWAQAGDIFMSRSNTPELVGQAAIYNGTPARVIYPDLLIRIQPDPSKADIRFVHYWLMSQSARKHITSNARGSSGTMKKITLEMVRSIPFPSHLEKEQQRHIADDIDRKVVIAKNLLAAADKQVEAANALPNSFLNATFGGFVPPIEE